MSQIRRQSILSTVLVYAGFLAGFVNTYLFTRQGSPFSTSEYAMTTIFLAVGNLMFAFANMGMITVVYKFYPYYKDSLPKKKIDLMAWTIVISLIGFLLVVLGGVVFKDLIVRKFATNSPLFLQYFNWIFPFSFGILFFSLFEAFAWNIRESVFTTFLRELLFKGLVLGLILLLSFKVIDGFDAFIKLYSLTFGVTALILLIFLMARKEFPFTLTISNVTRKFYKKMRAMAVISYFGGIVYMVANFIDMLIIMSVLGTDEAGIYSLGLVVGSLVQAPQRGAVAAATPVLSQAWKDKDHEKIQRIYNRSGLNLLIGSLAIFLLIWLSYSDIVESFHLQPAYLDSLWVFFFVGLARIVDLGTGINSQIISTSSYWRFEFVSGMVLLAVIVPLDYILVKKIGIVGAGVSMFFAMAVYNIVRIVFLYAKFRMHPFSVNMLYSVFFAGVSYFICYYAFQSMHGFPAIILRSLLFIVLFGGTVYFFKLTPDLVPVLKTLKKRVTGESE
ncbi:MAG: polysaccharide biosynthesis C-terminal domain-containing protein [Chitinophagaceae bacterium]|nr:polysaccharide biosynthesis C-terminal domain-containing protein [Chitinophagaceae bacterium]